MAFWLEAAAWISSTGTTVTWGGVELGGWSGSPEKGEQGLGGREQQRSPCLMLLSDCWVFAQRQTLNSYAVIIVWEVWAGYFTSLDLSFLIRE